MNKTQSLLNANELEVFLGKSSIEFTKSDIKEFIRSNKVEFVNFMYPAADHRLKTLNFVVNNEAYLDDILSHGERVDGSSLFPYIESGNSDLYVVPRFRTAFLDPFASQKTLCLLCSFFDRNGNLLDISSEYTLMKANKKFSDETGMQFLAMVEMEYYVIGLAEEQTRGFDVLDQKGYHESAPFAKFIDFRKNCMAHIARIGGNIKYGHSEVGNFKLDGKIYEQNEIEFLPTEIEKTAEILLLSQWIMRNLANARGLEINFAPKITTGKAGSGMHVHMQILKDGKNMLLENGVLSDIAKKAIAGMIVLSPSLTAFGNMKPNSYFRLVPQQEAPTNICWGDSNRSVLIRVPLGWTVKKNMLHTVNPLESDVIDNTEIKQTVEIRSPDGTADIHLLLAGLAVACCYGLQLPNALEIAERTYAAVNIHSKEHIDKLNSLEQLPASCSESAQCLNKQRLIYESDGVFSSQLIDTLIKQLSSFRE